MKWPEVIFETLYSTPSRNGVYKPKEFHGRGCRIVNMGELFGFEFISNQEMSRVELRDVELATNSLEDGDLLFGRRSLVESGAGKCSIVVAPPEPLTFESSLIRVRLQKNAVNPRFLYYYFRSPHGRGRIKSIVSGTNVKGIRGSDLKNIPLPYPPKDIQDRISATLSAYDDLIENNRRRMALLEESARQLYQEWFVRLRFPGYEHTRITDGVPDGWERVTLGELVALNEIELQTGPFGTQLKASDYTEVGAPVINVRNIGFGAVRREKLEYIPEEVVDRLHQHVLKTGDIVFGRKGAVERHVLIAASQNGWVQGSDCIRLRSNSDRVSTSLLSLAFREATHKEWMLTQCSNKATMASLNQEVIGRIATLLPSHSIHREFVDLVSVILNQIELLERQSEKARQARDLLLPRLMSGEITV